MHVHTLISHSHLPPRVPPLQVCADISMVPVAEVMRERAQAIGLMESPAEEWDAPVRVHAETLGQVLGMDWGKYSASMAVGDPRLTPCP